MAQKKSEGSKKRTKPRAMLTPEAQEQQIAADAIRLAHEQILNGTASSQVLTHFLKLATVKAQLELEILHKQKELIEAKTESLQSNKVVEELYTNALEAMSIYKGTNDENY